MINKKPVFAVLLLLVLCYLEVTAQTKPIRDLQPTVILLSLDGFRYDYLDKYRPVNLTRLAREGARAKWLIPVFPSKTFPNHYSIATGLYPAQHGIVENTVYDPEFDAVFALNKREEVQNGRWWLGEPIWVTAEKQGQRAGAYFFPGTEAEIGGKRPTFWKTYDDNIANAGRVKTILSWLDLPRRERPTMYTLYFSDTDNAGHEYGPDAPETAAAVQKVDGDIGLLLQGLRERNIFNRVNLIIVSDHGMATQDWRKAVIMDEMFDVSLTERIFWANEIVSIYPKAGRENEIYTTLKQKLPPTVKIYRQDELPARFHYTGSPRLPPLIVLPDEGLMVTNRERYERMEKDGQLNHPRGGHGYDNRLVSMRATFIGHGSAFKRGRILPPVANIHIYNLMAKILRLRPAPNAGDMRLARLALR